MFTTNVKSLTLTFKWQRRENYGHMIISAGKKIPENTLIANVYKVY